MASFIDFPGSWPIILRSSMWISKTGDCFLPRKTPGHSMSAKPFEISSKTTTESQKSVSITSNVRVIEYQKKWGSRGGKNQIEDEGFREIAREITGKLQLVSIELFFGYSNSISALQPSWSFIPSLHLISLVCFSSSQNAFLAHCFQDVSEGVSQGVETDQTKLETRASPRFGRASGNSIQSSWST